MSIPELRTLVNSSFPPAGGEDAVYRLDQFISDAGRARFFGQAPVIKGPASTAIQEIESNTSIKGYPQSYTLLKVLFSTVPASTFVNNSDDTLMRNLLLPLTQGGTFSNASLNAYLDRFEQKQQQAMAKPAAPEASAPPKPITPAPVLASAAPVTTKKPEPAAPAPQNTPEQSPPAVKAPPPPVKKDEPPPAPAAIAEKPATPVPQPTAPQNTAEVPPAPMPAAAAEEKPVAAPAVQPQTPPPAANGQERAAFLAANANSETTRIEGVSVHGLVAAANAAMFNTDTRLVSLIEASLGEAGDGKLSDDEKVKLYNLWQVSEFRDRATAIASQINAIATGDTNARPVPMAGAKPAAPEMRI